MNFLIEDITILFMVFIRAGALLMILPFLNGQLVPVRMRLAVAIILTAMTYGIIHGQSTMPETLVDLILMGTKEALIGLLMGLAVRIIFFMVEFAGHVISTETGLMMSSSFDPISATHASTIGSLLFYLTSLIFLITGMHREVFIAFARSFEFVPLSTNLQGLMGINTLAKSSSQIFSVGLQMAAPLVALNFIITISFAVLGKAAPKINVFMLSFSIRILGGLTLLFMTLGLITQYIYLYVKESPERMLEFLTY